MISFHRLHGLPEVHLQYADGGSNTGRVVIRLSQNVTEPTNTALGDGAVDARLAELLIGYKNGSVHPLDGLEGMRPEAIDVEGEGLCAV